MNKCKQKKALSGNASEENNHFVKIDFDPKTAIAVTEGKVNSFGFDLSDTRFIKFEKKQLEFEVIGELNLITLSKLQVMLKVSKKPHISASEVYRNNVDLFSDNAIDYFANQASSKLRVTSPVIKDAIYDLTENLENYRKSLVSKQSTSITIDKLQPKEVRKVNSVLKSKNLIDDLKALFVKAGTIDVMTALKLFIISLSAKTEDVLHTVLHASPLITNELLKSQVKFVPQEQLRAVTSLSENALFYAPSQNYWKNKVLVLPTIDFLSKKHNSLIEFVTQSSLNRLVTQADKSGNYKSQLKKVNGPICLQSATTTGVNNILKSDNVLSLIIDNIPEIKAELSTRSIKHHAGLIDKNAEIEAQKFIQHLYREIQSLQVVNKYLDELDLQTIFNNDIHQIGLFLRLTNLITLLHQKQLGRSKSNGVEQIEVQKEHMQICLELFRSVWAKDEDELPFHVARTYISIKNELKKINKKAPESVSFTAIQIRPKTKLSPATLQRHLNKLVDYGKLERSGNKKIGFSYKVAVWKTEATGAKTYTNLEQQLNSL